jgi:hypothetical protein
MALAFARAVDELSDDRFQVEIWSKITLPATLKAAIKYQ